MWLELPNYEEHSKIYLCQTAEWQKFRDMGMLEIKV